MEVPLPWTLVVAVSAADSLELDFRSYLLWLEVVSTVGDAVCKVGA
jgi:hypothetical protein